MSPTDRRTVRKIIFEHFEYLVAEWNRFQERKEKAHEVQEVSIAGTVLRLRVDGRLYDVDLAQHSKRLARATPEQRARLEVSPSGYGLHWPELDEDLSIDGLIGITHSSPVLAARRRQV